MTSTESESSPSISTEECRKRLEAVNFGRGSVRLDGFVLDDATEALYARYVNGDLDRAELNAAILGLPGPSDVVMASECQLLKS